jgi:hypothetical protein
MGSHIGNDVDGSQYSGPRPKNSIRKGKGKAKKQSGKP